MSLSIYADKNFRLSVFSTVVTLFTTAPILAALSVLASNASAHPLTTIYSFGNESRNGDDPNGLAMDQAGNTFGITQGGGYIHKGCSGTGCGTAYELKRGKVFKLVYRFCAEAGCGDGQVPFGSLIVDIAGNLYGTTEAGGAHNEGTIFELSPTGTKWTYHKLYDFCSQGGGSCTDGAVPVSGLTYAGASTGILYDGVSPLYGTTEGGGTGDRGGVAYQLTLAQGQWTETVLYSFCSQGGPNCTDGLAPEDSLLVDAQGNLFGTTIWGGTNHPNGFSLGAGVAFELSPNGGAWTESVLYDFCGQTDCSDGTEPSSSLIQDSAGTLLGTTEFGGNSCTLGATTCGTVFKLAYNGTTWQESVLHAFCAKSDCPDGAYPSGTLAMDSSGDLFGTAFFGGGNDSDPDHDGGGVLFELNGSSFKVLHSFCALTNCADGNYPLTGVLQNANGVLLGTTVFGGTAGSSGGGTVFKLKP